MAFNFLELLPTFETLQEQERHKYCEIIAAMDNRYQLERGQPAQLAEDLHCSYSQVALIARVMRRTISLYERDTKVLTQTNERAERNDPEALKALSLYDPNVSWAKVQETIKRAQRNTKAVVPPTSTPQSITDQVSALEQLNVRLQKENAALRRALDERDRRLYVLSQQVSKLTRDVEQSDQKIAQKTRTELTHDFVMVEQLLEHAKIFGDRESAVIYTAAFQSAYTTLGPEQKKRMRKVLGDLAALGARSTQSQQEHKKLPSDRSYAKKGSMVSRATRNVRYVWAYEGERGARQLILYFVGTHDKIWMSEK